MVDLIRPDDGIRVRGLRRVEFERMVALGMFEGGPIELIGGELVEVSPQGAPHFWVITRLNSLLAPLIDAGDELRVQGPFAVDEMSLPEPDLAVADPASPTAHPTTAHLAIEVSRSSQRLDLVHKPIRYAAAGIPTYVVFDLPARQVVVHTDPSPEGYRTVQRRGPDQRLELLGIDLDLADLLRPEVATTA